MKNSIRRKHILNIRPLKPKSNHPMQNLAIERLSFIQDADGITHMSINLNHITLDSRELISMIDEKKDRIDTGNNGYILRKDILTAIHNYQTNNDKTKASKNGNHSDHDAIRVQESKRPANAFILYNNALRKKIKSLFPNYSNSDISKILGGMWKSVGDSEKDKYIKKAIECRNLHKKRYPNFEYNIKRDPAINCTKFSDSQKANNWENYFDWCLQNSSTESSVGALQHNNGSVINQTSIHWPNPLIRSDSAVSNGLLLQDLKMLAEWNEVCQIVSRFFPGETDQNELMDEQFWRSLDSVDFLTDLDVGSPGLQDTNSRN